MRRRQRRTFRSSTHVSFLSRQRLQRLPIGEWRPLPRHAVRTASLQRSGDLPAAMVWTFPPKPCSWEKTDSPIGIGVITRRGSGTAGTPEISESDIFDDDLEAGIRLSGSLIFGAGGNIEATYIGGQEWNGSATATGTGDLFSFITDFGVNPAVIDDVDQSVSQTATSTAEFHSGELNYRRRTVGPYCRFQGSWLFGLRHLRYDNGLGLDIVGLTDDGTSAGPDDDILRFFNGFDDVENAMLGGQIGGDLWWNVCAGVNLGFGLKGAWLKNTITHDTRYNANSINAGAPGSFTNRARSTDTTVAGEFQAKLVYRLTHSWSFRSAYYVIAIDDVATPTFDGQFIQAAVNNAIADPGDPALIFDRVTMQGFSVGAEYIW